MNKPITQLIALSIGAVITPRIPSGPIRAIANLSNAATGSVNKVPIQLNAPLTMSKIPPIVSLIKSWNENESNTASALSKPNAPRIHDTAPLSISNGQPINVLRSPVRPPSIPPMIPPSLNPSMIPVMVPIAAVIIVNGRNILPKILAKPPKRPARRDTNPPTLVTALTIP